MEAIFSGLSQAVGGAPLVALAAALAWGVLSVVLSPCHLASIPLVVAFVSRQGATNARGAFWISSLFSLGILVTIGLIGAATAAAGRIMGNVGSWSNYLVAAVFLLVGLNLLGVLPLPWSGPGQVGVKRKGLLAAFVMGLIFGLALGPCTFAFMAPLLGVAFRLAATRLPYAIGLLAAYGIGHCAVIVLAGASTGLVQRYLNWTEQSCAATRLRAACGVLVILGGLWLIYSAP